MPASPPASAPVPTRFFGLLGGWSLLLSSGFLLLIFGLTSYEQVRALGSITYHEGGYRRLALALTPARYQLLRDGLAAVAGLSGGLLLGLGYWRGTA
ncbi:MAG: hypothetical protein H7Z21_11115, partial [Hymenobacter sp.]|nr:hypothetical protein [Hymenobacter sp.]